jgi:hypothetical protein
MPTLRYANLIYFPHHLVSLNPHSFRTEPLPEAPLREVWYHNLCRPRSSSSSHFRLFKPYSRHADIVACPTKFSLSRPFAQQCHETCSDAHAEKGKEHHLYRALPHLRIKHELMSHEFH